VSEPGIPARSERPNKEEKRVDQEREDLNRAEQLAARARELSQRAAEISERASDAADSEAAMAALERELADLDEEERRLDEEFADLLDDRTGRASDDVREGESTEDRTEDRVTSWADRFAERMETLGDRIGEALTGAFATRSFGASDTVEREVAVDGPLPVTIDSFAGSVSVRPGDGSRVHVVAERHAWSDAQLDDITIDVRRGEGGVEVRATAPATFGRRWVKLDVIVPRTSPVHAHTQGGAVRVEGVGGPVTASTQGGAIRVDGAVGVAQLETMGGAVTVSNHQGPVTARTKGGGVKLGGKLGGEVDAETMGGSIQIDGADGAVRAQTMGGSVKVSGALRGDSTLSTVGGSVSVRLTRGTKLKVSGSGSSASTDVDGLQASRGRVEGTIGDGSDGHLTLHTSGGSVRVQQG
jgi:hypothetical protein